MSDPTSRPGQPTAGRESEGRPSLLGTPLRVGRVELRNRIVSPPMERNYCTMDGRVTDRYIAYLRARAAGGAALLFTGGYVCAGGRAWAGAPVGRAREIGRASCRERVSDTV